MSVFLSLICYHVTARCKQCTLSGSWLKNKIKTLLGGCHTDTIMPNNEVRKLQNNTTLHCYRGPAQNLVEIQSWVLCRTDEISLLKKQLKSLWMNSSGYCYLIFCLRIGSLHSKQYAYVVALFYHTLSSWGLRVCTEERRKNMFLWFSFYC